MNRQFLRIHVFAHNDRGKQVAHVYIRFTSTITHGTDDITSAVGGRIVHRADTLVANPAPAHQPDGGEILATWLSHSPNQGFTISTL